MTDQHAQLELAQDYAARRLDPANTAAFEEHLLVCEQCQTEVRLAVGLRRIIRAEPASSSAGRARWTIGVAALLAAGLVAFLVLPSRVDRRVIALGQVKNPPAYIGMSVRALPQHGDSLFNAAMAAYTARDYGVAASGLRAALAAGVDTIPTQFFLASAELMAGHPKDAAADYARVIAAGPAAAPYLPEAHLYRARALLLLGRAADALAELGAVGRADATYGGSAAALADSVTQVMRR